MTKLFLLASLVIVLSACSSPNPTVNQATPSPQSTKAAETTMTISEKDLDFIKDPSIKKHFLAQFNVKTMRVKSFSDGRGTVQTTQLDNTTNEPKLSMLEEEGKKTTSAIIQINKTTYMQNPKDGQWWYEVEKTVTPSKDEPAQTNDIDTQIKETQEALPKESDQPVYKLLGEEACGTEQCYKYDEVQKDGSKRTFWIGKKDYLLRKEISSFGEFYNTTEYSYDNINIIAPANAKMVPDGKSVYEFISETNPPAKDENVEEITGE